MPTREQLRAQRAFERVVNHKAEACETEYKRFCRRFPTLILNCGFVQALAFAEAKGHTEYLSDLAYVIDEKDPDSMKSNARTYESAEYQKLTRDALVAASWIKRYGEALLEVR